MPHTPTPTIPAACTISVTYDSAKRRYHATAALAGSTSPTKVGTGPTPFDALCNAWYALEAELGGWA